jgi:uncharacterized protein
VLIAAGLLAAAASTALAQTPSFDCAKAATADEKAICADAELAELDRLTAQAFNEAKRTGGREKAIATARASLEKRQSCKADKACILEEQLAVLERYQKLGAKVAPPAWAKAEPAAPAAVQQPQGPRPPDQPLPTKVGKCAATTIALIADRFGNSVGADPQGGTAVWFANTGFQVSYEKVEAIIKSAIGDPVEICLVELPKNCPPGDERGKIYQTKNLRTGEQWSLPDAQHSCGGA